MIVRNPAPEFRMAHADSDRKEIWQDRKIGLRNNVEAAILGEADLGITCEVCKTAAGGNVVDRTSKRVVAIQRALRTFDNLDPLKVG